MKTAIITGCGGLVGSCLVKSLGNDYNVIGIDNNSRMMFFGNEADVSPVIRHLSEMPIRFKHINSDIRNSVDINSIFDMAGNIATVIHCAAQPSHDKASEFPLVDFSINANGTLVLLEAARKYCPDVPFIHISTNKVYGDRPNSIPVIEKDTRWDYAKDNYADGIDESMSIDMSMHSLFGVSKTSADLLVQEYGRYFGMPTVVFRCGCITGEDHRGVEKHGFLSYMVKCAVYRKKYYVYGYKGKQVRDQIHADDLVEAIREFIRKPKRNAVYNMGGGRINSASLIELVNIIRRVSGLNLETEYLDRPRLGDHICYISNTKKFSNEYQGWKLNRGINDIVERMVAREIETSR